jgi:nucleotide-binding universal stress UspA family protein
MADAPKTRVVVGCDLSASSDHALWQAMSFARQLHACELHITQVIPTARELHDARKLEQLASELPMKLEQLRQHVVSVCAPLAEELPFRVECEFHLCLGEPAWQLHQVAVDVEAQLIVIGARPHTRMATLLEGSVGEALLRMTKVSVLVAHSNALAGLPKSAHLEPRRSEQPLYGEHLSSRTHLELLPRTAHISGLL